MLSLIQWEELLTPELEFLQNHLCSNRQILKKLKRNLGNSGALLYVAKFCFDPCFFLKSSQYNNVSFYCRQTFTAAEKFRRELEFLQKVMGLILSLCMKIFKHRLVMKCLVFAGWRPFRFETWECSID